MKSISESEQKDIGDRIRNLRKEKGLTQTELAEKLDYCESPNSKGYISQWETGKELPPFERIVMMSDLFDVSVDYILCRSDYRHVENEGIFLLTALSDKSIEILRKKTGLTDETIDNLWWKKDLSTESAENLWKKTGLSRESIENLRKNKREGDNRYLFMLDLILSDEKTFNELMDNLIYLVFPPYIAITDMLLKNRNVIYLTPENLDEINDNSSDKVFHRIREVLLEFVKKNKGKEIINSAKYHPNIINLEEVLENGEY